MEGSLLTKTYFLAGRSARISQDSATTCARAALHAAAWANSRVYSLARLLNPFNWRLRLKEYDFTGGWRLQRKILEISAAERQRIGRDLHDGVGQILSGVAFMGRALEHKLAVVHPDGSADAAQIAEIAEDGMARTRSLARVLNPMRLEAGGLTAALEQMASDFEKVFGVSCTFEHDARPLVDDNSVATHVYRIAQEAVANAIRHGEAKHVVIKLSSRELAGGEGLSAADRLSSPKSAQAGVTLTVQDDGTGFEKNDEDEDKGADTMGTITDEADGMGLRIMDYRAKMIEGALTIRRRPEGGALLTCAFPSERNKQG